MYSPLSNSRGGGNKREGGAKVLQLINEEKGINENQGAKGVKSVTKLMRRGELCKRLINEEGRNI